MSLRNPKDFKVGERVKVVTPAHRDFGKEGVIEKIEGVDVPHGKPRAHICIDKGGIKTFMHVSLPNLERMGE